ncbi:hypothetical protein ACFE04_017661 [Oxalis oulophora]
MAKMITTNNTTTTSLLFSSPSKTPSFNSLLNHNNKKNTCALFLNNPSLHSSYLCYRLTTTTPRVSTAPVEYAPSPPPNFNFNEEISRLKTLRTRLTYSKKLKHKLSIIDNDPRVKRFFSSGGVARVLNSFNLEANEVFLFKCVVAAGQEHMLSVLESSYAEEETVRSAVKSALYTLAEMIERWEIDSNGNGKTIGFNGHNNNGVVFSEEEIDDFKRLLKHLGEIERFYDCIGGIIGYQITVLELLAESTLVKHTSPKHISENLSRQLLEIHTPKGLDLSQNTEYASQVALWGIEGLPDLGEIYPLGGSADRLGLVDPDTGECLPAAMLPYCGRTLLEGLIRDLQAREYLYYKLYGKQCITPVAIMTSSAKKNHQHITSLCERLGWFGRGRSSFQLFEQPLVPAVSAEDGQWLVSKPFTPVCKPGGHGAIWKLAYDKGIFQWFYKHGRKGATVRQISNVVAATDLTLLALAGIGLRYNKNPGATEGVNVLIEKKDMDGKCAYGLSCIEYTEFDKFGITSGPLSANSNVLLAEFPANTNILYVDLPSVELIASSNNERSLPGMVLNTKKPIVYKDQFGQCHSAHGGRLECTMQSIADNFATTYSSKFINGGLEDGLDTFLVYNKRRRVTSSAKRKRKHMEKSLHQTPDGALLDILRNAYDILSQCDIKLPEIEGNDKYVDSGPPYLIFLHPALGPLWEVTRQKFKGGSISKGSELQIEVAEFMWKNVELDGSLIIVADNVLGSTKACRTEDPELHYGHRCARCKLDNVKVQNLGIDWEFLSNVYWKHDVERCGECKVILHGNAEFEAKDVVLQGNHLFEVPDGYKMKITSGNPGIAVQLDTIEEKMIDTGSWHWKYNIDGSRIRLELVEL